MRTFKIVNRDLVIGQSSYEEIMGRAKIAQDLEIATLTPYGSDRFHRGYGSLLAQKIGLPESNLSSAQVQGEVQRIINNYMLVQQMTLQAYQARGFASPYTNADLVAQVTALNVVVNTDSITVDAQIQTAANQTVGLNTTVTP
jgi:phage baseplate assembly protein W